MNKKNKNKISLYKNIINIYIKKSYKNNSIFLNFFLILYIILYIIYYCVIYS